MPFVAAYPTAIPQFSEKYDFTDVVFAAHVNALQAEITAITATLGLSPQGASATVRARLDSIDQAVSAVAGRFNAEGKLAQANVDGLVAALQALQNAINARVLTSDFNSAVSALQGADSARVLTTTFQGAVDNLQAQINSLQSNPGGVSQSYVDNADANLQSQINQRVTTSTYNTAISQLQNRDTYLEGLINGHSHGSHSHAEYAINGAAQPSSNVKGRRAEFQTDAGGYATVTHLFGFTPGAVVGTGFAPISGTTAIPVNLVIDTLTATTFRVRVFDVNGVPFANGVGCTVQFIGIQA